MRIKCLPPEMWQVAIAKFTGQTRLFDICLLDLCTLQKIIMHVIIRQCNNKNVNWQHHSELGWGLNRIQNKWEIKADQRLGFPLLRLFYYNLKTFFGGWSRVC